MPATIYVFYGEDEFSIAEAIEQVKASLGPREALGANTSVLDGKQAPLGDLLLACGAVPFLADHRLVIAEGLLDRFEDGGARGARARRAGREGPGMGEWSTLAEAAYKMPPSTTLIVTGGAVRPQNPLLRSLERVAQCRRFAPIRAAQMVPWIDTRAKAHGGRFEPMAARVLAEFSGGNLRQMDQEIEKLCTYAGGQPVTEAMVRQLSSSMREARIFDLMDAVAQRRRETAMRSLEQLLLQGAAPPYILTMLARQVRQMIAAKALSAEGAGRDALMSALETSSDFVVDKTLEQARAYRMDDLKALLDRLLEADLAYKTGTVSDELALELLIAETAGTGRV